MPSNVNVRSYFSRIISLSSNGRANETSRDSATLREEIFVVENRQSHLMSYNIYIPYHWQFYFHQFVPPKWMSESIRRISVNLYTNGYSDRSEKYYIIYKYDEELWIRINCVCINQKQEKKQFTEEIRNKKANE